MRIACVLLLLSSVALCAEDWPPKQITELPVPEPNFKPDPEILKKSKDVLLLDVDKDTCFVKYDGKPYTGWSHLKEGRVVTATMFYQDGWMHGETKTWWITGRPQSIEHYENGKEHGRFLMWFPNGVLHKDATFKNGINTHLRQWHGNGNLFIQAAADDKGRDHGDILIFHADGDLFIKQTKNHGKSVNTRIYNEEGNYGTTKTFKDGAFMNSIINANGKIISNHEYNQKSEAE